MAASPPASTWLKPSIVLIALIVICTACNLTKAVHIDDTAYLEIAQAILRDPLHAMSAEINWDFTARPIWTTNQPHLVMALYALVMGAFGPSELALHALMAVFTALAIVFFYRLALRVASDHALLLTALFALGPAFLPAQNLMTDIPAMALWLIAFWAIFTADPARPAPRYALAALVIGLACLAKYPTLALLPVFALTLLIRKHARALWTLLIPLAVLAAWSALNYYDYGGFHMLQRVEGGATRLDIETISRQALEWTATLGAVAPSVLGFWVSHPRKRTRIIVAAVGVVAGVLMATVISPPVPWESYAPYWGVFMGLGALALGLVVRSIADGLARPRALQQPGVAQDTLILTLWILAAAGFIILWTPFMAARHVLLALPPILLLLGRHAARLGVRPGAPGLAWGGLALTALLGLTLAVSDYGYAHIYRVYARRIPSELPADARIWYAGHWGWQWYANQAGMQQLDVMRSPLREGDYLVVPLGNCPQIIPTADQTEFELVRQIDVPAGPSTWLRTMTAQPWGGLYAATLVNYGPPWHFSTKPLETFLIYRVVAPPG
ncbi:MAG: hypothetical protein GX601_06610 [Anaerolineales bacterium]|nr:hypothetical protein [Anaerolineales bacterium]